MIELNITLHESNEGDVMAHVNADMTVGTGREEEVSDRIVEFIEGLGLGEVVFVGYDMPPDLEEELITGDYYDDECDGYYPACEYAEECYYDEDILGEDDDTTILEVAFNTLDSYGINPSDCKIYKVYTGE